MKTEALTYTLVTVGLAAVMALFLGMRADIEVGTVLGWATAGVLFAMAPLDYRLAWKRITGR
ncbi:MAG: hypothetical protein HZA31_13470 [Opitutae bacterium]|nr:hypothetical protein [Opitutae bacterium]